MERYIAIDNVCAWPNLTLMPDGAIIATIFNQPTHGGWEGDLECWASTDGGITWAKRGTPAPHEPATNRMNAAAGLARDGALIVFAGGWTKRPPRSEPPRVKFDDSDFLLAWVCRSSDGGYTWTRDGRITLPAELHRNPSPFGDMVQLPDGTLGVSLYGRRSSERQDGIAHLYRSADDGHTWEAHSVIAAGDYNETTLLAHSSGRVLAAARTWQDGHLDLLFSDDSGATWVNRGPVTLAGQHPAQLLELADGRILLVYGIRNPGLYGVGARVSDDRGATWSLPRLLVNLGGDKVDCGYPASVQLPDGGIVTAYYAAGTEAHQRYHMGVVRWSPD